MTLFLLEELYKSMPNHQLIVVFTESDECIYSGFVSRIPEELLSTNVLVRVKQMGFKYLHINLGKLEVLNMKKTFPLKNKPSKYYMVTVQFDTEPYLQINRVLFSYNGSPLLYFKYNYKKDTFIIEATEIDRNWIIARNVKDFLIEFAPRLSYNDCIKIQHNPDEYEVFNISDNNVANEILYNVWTIIKDGNYKPVSY